MTEAEIIVSSIIGTILDSLVPLSLPSESLRLSDNQRNETEVQEIIISLLDNLILEITAHSGNEDDNTSTYSDSLFTLPEDFDEGSETKDFDKHSFQVVPIEEIEQTEDLDEMKFYDESPSKTKISTIQNSDRINEQSDEVLQAVPNDTTNQNLTSSFENRAGKLKNDHESKFYNELSEFGDNKLVTPLKVSADSLVLNFKPYADAGPKRKHENDLEDVVYHTQLQVAMPKLLNAVPRLGLSKYSKLPKLHKRMKF